MPKKKSALQIPDRFCWTKFGSEAGETIEQILARKERERLVNGGVFLWGIGNSVRPGIWELVAKVQAPKILFSPMRSPAKAEDSTPDAVVRWTEATGLDGREWSLPPGSVVTSRATTSGSTRKSKHYALVCTAESPLVQLDGGERLDFSRLRNLATGGKLGFSQVTSVVEFHEECSEEGPLYPIGLMAALTYPYFVELAEPVTQADWDRPLLAKSRARQHYLPSVTA